MMSLIVKGGLPIVGELIGTGGEVSWTYPVRPGDTIHVVSEIMDISYAKNGKGESKSSSSRANLVVRQDVYNQSEKLVMRFTVKAVIISPPSLSSACI
jgi:acyl dehydratase